MLARSKTEKLEVCAKKFVRRIWNPGNDVLIVASKTPPSNSSEGGKCSLSK